MVRADGPAVRLLDFQTPRYAPPAQDVEMLLCTCAGHALLAERGDELRDRYYTSLRARLSAAGLRAEALLSREAFAASCAEYAPLGRLAAAVFHSNNLLPQVALRASLARHGRRRHLVRDRVALVTRAFADDAAFRRRITRDLREIVARDLAPPTRTPTPTPTPTHEATEATPSHKID
ncbi:Protein of unknown function [Gryllus bimaculatus]|nr:Protein of unknown function [Gryllus bimaculatus]